MGLCVLNAAFLSVFQNNFLPLSTIVLYLCSVMATTEDRDRILIPCETLWASVCL